MNQNSSKHIKIDTMSSILQRVGTIAHMRPLVAIIGPTGTGKSQLAVEIARQFNGEIINADVLQLYKGLPIATNKPSEKQMQGVPHHLMGCINIHEPTWTVGKFVKEAENCIEDIAVRGKLPIVVGGSHYYIYSLLFRQNLLNHDIAEPQLDAESRWPILNGTSEEMLHKLKILDPVAASWWHPHEHRKIRRSLEICLNTGRKASEIYKEQTKNSDGDSAFRYEALCLYLHSDREGLAKRLNSRVEDMVESGLIDEAKYMRKTRQQIFASSDDFDHTSGIWIAIGFKELETYLEAVENETDPQIADSMKQEAAERIMISTRQYATRQSRYVKNKILPSFRKSRHNTLFQFLNASDPACWEEKVATPGKELTRRYVNDLSLLDPAIPSLSAIDYLESTPQEKSTNTCALCNIVTTTQREWQQHLKSKRHRRSSKISVLSNMQAAVD